MLFNEKLDGYEGKLDVVKSKFGEGKLGSMILFQGKNLPIIVDIVDISTKPILLCSPQSPSSNETNLFPAESLLPKLAHVSMLFICHLVCSVSSVSSAGKLKNK